MSKETKKIIKEFRKNHKGESLIEVEEAAAEIQIALEAQKQEFRDMVEGMRKEKKQTPQTGLFGNCPKCGQEVNVKFVESVLKEVRIQALSDILKKLEL